MVEHLAPLHDHPVPAWVNEPERFLDAPWIVATNRWTRLSSLMLSPPAFLRHGAIPDPRDLDRRGGESAHLTVTGASPRHLLAMKLLAPRNVEEELKTVPGRPAPPRFG